MTDRPIIFSAPMVRTILDGRKWQTRRVLKPQPPAMPRPDCHPAHLQRHDAPYLDAYCNERRTALNHRGMSIDWHWWQIDDRPGPCVTCAPCIPGDRLWVREAHYLTDDGENEYAVFAADQDDVDEHLASMQTTMASHTSIDWSKHLRLRPSIHMPRWASRLTLIVTDVRVQRLQDISGEDCAAEGVCEFAMMPPTDGDVGEARIVFRDLWNSLHGPDAWDDNPWVAAISFRTIHANIDSAEAAA